MTNPTAKHTLADLIAVMAALRTPGTGCPWDLEQSFVTIAPYTIEEAYEVADAIERGELAELKDELGDLLFQVVYHARMAEEHALFDFADVADAITAKMIRRHPHVFGDATVKRATDVKGLWERVKAEERAVKAARRGGGVRPSGSDTLATPSGPGPADDGGAQVSDPEGLTPLPERANQPGLLADVPLALPALTRAIKLQDKAARVGFDWPGLAPVFDKMREELAELEHSLTARDAGKVAEEFGDLLFVMANVARHLKLDPEAALRSANAKFIRRFRHIERRLAEAGRTPAQSDLAEMDRLWDEAKARERGQG